MERSTITLFFSKVKDINTFIFDVDGVMTNGNLYYYEEAENIRVSRGFNAKDGLALQMALAKGFNIAIITGGFASHITKRFNTLGIKDVFIGINDKKTCFENYIKQYKIDPQKVLYMGDDLPDIPVMKKVAIAAAPQNAVVEILDIADFISTKAGGDACVRDVIEKVLRAQNKWEGSAFKHL